MAGQDSDKLFITLHCYDTDLRLNVPREDEGYYRNAAKLIDAKVNKYAKIFKGEKSDKEILYMVLLDIALNYEKEAEHNDTEPYINIMNKLTSEIETVLK